MITDRKDFRDNITVDPNAVCHTERSEVSMFNTLLDSMPSAMLLMLVAKKKRVVGQLLCYYQDFNRLTHRKKPQL